MAGATIEVRPAPAAAPATGPVLAPTRRSFDATPTIALAALLGGLALYGASVAPGVQGGDSGEFQFVGYVLGIPHPPGYPLYAMLGKLWASLVPFGEVAYRMNLLSAAFAAATLGAVAWAAGRAVGPGAPSLAAGAVAAGWLAVSPTWWSQATIASVRPLTGFFLAATLAALTSYVRFRNPRALYAAAALYGLGLTHHISLYTLAPALALFLLISAPTLLQQGRTLVRAGLALAAPLLAYAYLPIRSAMGASFDASHPTTLGAFFDLVTARGFAGDMLFFDPLSPPRLELGRQILLTNFGALGLALALLGGVATLLWRPRWALLTGAVALINLAIGLSYRAPVIADYLIPTYVVLALWIGLLAALPAAILWRLNRPVGLIGAALGLALLFPAASYARDHWASFDLSDDRDDEHFLSETLALAAPNATLLTDWYHTTILWYGQYARGQRPDLRIDYVAPEGPAVPWLRKAREALARGPVYATALDPALGQAYHLQRVGPLYAVLAEPSRDLAADLMPSGIRFGDAIELVGYRLEPAPDGADVSLSLYWRALAPLGRDVSEFVHVVDETGHVWGQRDGAPGEGAYPTSRWRAGEVVAERYSFALAPSAPSGELSVEVGFYESLPAGGWRRFEARGPGGDPLGDAPSIARKTFNAPPLPADRRSEPVGVAERLVERVERLLRGDAARGGPDWAGAHEAVWIPFGHRVLLTGWAADRLEAPRGGRLRVALDFLPLGRIPEDAAVFIHLVDARGALRAQSDSVPVEGGLPTLRWAPDRLVRDTRRLALPADLPPGDYELRAGVYVMSTGAHFPVLDDARAKAGQGDFVKLATVRVRS